MVGLHGARKKVSQDSAYSGRSRKFLPAQGWGSSIVFAKSTCYQFMMLKEKECWNIIHFTCSVIAETECACDVGLLGYMHGGVGGTATRWCSTIQWDDVCPWSRFKVNCHPSVWSIWVKLCLGWYSHSLQSGLLGTGQSLSSKLVLGWVDPAGQGIFQDGMYMYMYMYACSSIFRGQPCMCLHRKQGPLLLLAFLFMLLNLNDKVSSWAWNW